MQPKTVKLLKNPWFWFVTLITVSRFATPFIIFLGYYPTVRHENWPRGLFYLLIIAVLTLGDAIDGTLANKFGVVSKAGDLLDHISDKLTLVAALVCWGVLLYQADLGAYRGLILWLTGIVLGLTAIEELLVARYNVSPVHWGTGANNDGRTKFSIQGGSLAIAGVGLTFYYGHPFALSYLTYAADLGFAIALYLGAISIIGYYQRDRALATK